MCAKKKEKMEEGEWTLSIYILLWAVAEMEQPLYFPLPLFSLSLSPPPHSFEKLSLSHSARKDLETPFPISIQVRSNTEPRFHRYWIKGLTLGCTRNYKVGCLWKSIARCISRDAVDKFSLPLIHPRWRTQCYFPFFPTPLNEFKRFRRSFRLSILLFKIGPVSLSFFS